MIQLLKKNIQTKNKPFLKSKIGNIHFFFIDSTIKIPQNVTILIQDKKIYFKGVLGEISLTFIPNLFFFLNQNQLLLSICIYKKKKSILNLYNKLIKIKIKGVLQGFKKKLILKGIGFKAFVEKDFLTLKLGFSHPIQIVIPTNIKIISQSNHLIFSSIDFIFLSEFVHKIKNLKKPEPYKGKGLLFNNEKILKKEGKKSKK